MPEEKDISRQLPDEESAQETKEKQSSIPQPETQLTHIEVHHHPKPEKKGLKEYFFGILNDIPDSHLRILY